MYNKFLDRWNKVIKHTLALQHRTEQEEHSVKQEQQWLQEPIRQKPACFRGRRTLLLDPLRFHERRRQSGEPQRQTWVKYFCKNRNFVDSQQIAVVCQLNSSLWALERLQWRANSAEARKPPSLLIQLILLEAKIFRSKITLLDNWRISKGNFRQRSSLLLKSIRTHTNSRAFPKLAATGNLYGYDLIPPTH